MDLTNIIVTLISGSLLLIGTIVTAISNVRLAKMKKEQVDVNARLHKQEAQELGIQALLRASIIDTYEKAKERGYCPLYVREGLTRQYKAYHLLGGNDIATRLFEAVMQMPIEPSKVCILKERVQEIASDELRLIAIIACTDDCADYKLRLKALEAEKTDVLGEIQDLSKQA